MTTRTERKNESVVGSILNISIYLNGDMSDVEKVGLTACILKWLKEQCIESSGIMVE